MPLTSDDLEQVREYIFRQLPWVLEKDPDFAVLVEGIVASKFPRRDEFARLLDELTASRQEQREGFARLDGRADTLEHRVDGLQAGQEELRAGQGELRADVKELRRLIDQRTSELRQAISDAFARLGQRWGMMTEDVLRQVVKAIVQETYGGEVQEITIEGEQYDCVISDGEHILLEITARATQKIVERLQRKRAAYIEHTGTESVRVLLATAQIHYTVARRLQEMGIEVIQPDILVEDEAADEIASGAKH